MHEGSVKAWAIWLVAGIFYLYEFIHRIALSVMLPELSASFNVSNAVLSSLSAYYFIAFAIAQIPVGLLIDRYGTRRLLTSACVVIAIASFLFATTNSIFIASLARVLIGFGSAFAFVSCLKLASTWFPGNKFAFIVGLTNLLGVCGALLAGNPVAYAVDLVGWRDVIFQSGVLGIGLAFLMWYVIRDGKRSTEKIKNKIKHVFANKQSWLIAIFAGSMVAPIVAYSELWGVAYLVDSYHINRPLAAQISTTTFIGIGMGGPTIGWLSDYFKKRTLFMCIGMIGAFITISFILFAPAVPIWLLYFLHIAFGFFSSSMLLAFSLNSEANAAGIRGTTIAFTNSVIMAAGAVLQSVSGLLLDYTDNNFTISFIPLICCYVIALISFKSIQDTHCRFCDE